MRSRRLCAGSRRTTRTEQRDARPIESARARRRRRHRRRGHGRLHRPRAAAVGTVGRGGRQGQRRRRGLHEFELCRGPLQLLDAGGGRRRLGVGAALGGLEWTPRPRRRAAGSPRSVSDAVPGTTRVPALGGDQPPRRGRRAIRGPGRARADPAVPLPRNRPVLPATPSRRPVLRRPAHGSTRRRPHRRRRLRRRPAVGRRQPHGRRPSPRRPRVPAHRVPRPRGRAWPRRRRAPGPWGLDRGARGRQRRRPLEFDGGRPSRGARRPGGVDAPDAPGGACRGRSGRLRPR